MPFRVFRINNGKLNATTNKSVLLRTYNWSKIQQSGRYTAKIRHNDKYLKCRFFVVPGVCPALLSIPDRVLLGIKRVMCKIAGKKTTGRKTDSQTRQVPGSQNCKTKKDPQAKPGKSKLSKGKINMPNYHNSSKITTNMPDYFDSSENEEVDKRVSEVITKRINNEFNYLFTGIGFFKGMFSLQVKEEMDPCKEPPRRVAYGLKQLQKQQIISLLGVDERLE